MSHIHIPDGVFSLPIWVGSYIVMVILLLGALYQMKKNGLERKIPYIAVMAATMLIAMSIPLGIVPLHISLAVFSGIFLGPMVGFVAVFVVNVILAFMGHGGITVIGLNTLVMGIEVFLGSLFFQQGWFQQKNSIFWRGFFITFLTLFISTSLATGFLVSTVGWEFVIPHSHHEDHTHERIESHEEHENYEGSIHIDHTKEEHNESNHKEALTEVNYLFFSGGLALFIILLVGILLESLITGGLLAFMMDIRPHLFEKNHSTKER